LQDILNIEYDFYPKDKGITKEIINSFWIIFKNRLIELGLPRLYWNLAKSNAEKIFGDRKKKLNRIEKEFEKLKNKFFEARTIVLRKLLEFEICAKEFSKKEKGYDLLNINQLYFIDIFDLEVKNIDFSNEEKSAISITKKICQITMTKDSNNEMKRKREEILKMIEGSELNIFSKISKTLKDKTNHFIKKLKTVGQTIPDIRLKEISVELGVNLGPVHAYAEFKFEVYQ